MKRAALLAVLLLATSVLGQRVPSSRTVLPRSPGSRVDITIPYTTNGWSTLGVWWGVSPRIISSPNLDNDPAPKMQNVYNLIFYGSRQGPGTVGIAATPRPGNVLRLR